MLYKYKSHSLSLIILEYITSFLILIQCNSLLISSLSKISLEICIFLLFVYGMLNIKRFHNDLSTLFIFLLNFILIISLFLMFNFYFYHYSLSNIISLLFNPIMLIVFFYSNIDKNKIDYSFILIIENTIILIAIISLLCWILASFGMKANTYIISDWGPRGQIVPGYFHLFYLPQGKLNFIGLNILRNSSIFVEAPVYAYALSIALLIELFVRKDSILNLRTLILIITIFTTASSIGIIIVILSLFYYILIRYNKNKLYSFLLFIFIVPLVIILLRIIIINKIGSGIDLNSSFNLRVNDITSSFRAWVDHPLIGNGISNSESTMKYMAYWRFVPGGDTGLSTGFMSTLAYGGIILALYYILPTIFVSKISNKTSGLALFSFILFMFTMVSTVSLYILLLSYFWAIFIYNK